LITSVDNVDSSPKVILFHPNEDEDVRLPTPVRRRRRRKYVIL
ncbi:hypothetical protein chiPu_0032305, partial [Chiloscyllium punctatum]|nr:hypothetical protein [Chiloscyllium punctatum]